MVHSEGTYAYIVRMAKGGDCRVEKYYCNNCCQIFSVRMICPQCELPVETKIHIQVQHQDGKKDHR